MKKKLLILISLLLVMTMIFVGCVPKTDDEPADTGEETETPVVDDEDEEDDDEEVADTGEKILKTNNASEPGSLDPALATGTHESWVLNHTFEGLMKLDEDGMVVEGMAESYELADDDVTYTFKMRDDVKWSNGDPVTAHDFEFAWKRALDPDLAADYAFQIYYIKGGEAYNTGEGSLEDVGVKALDDLTLEIVLESPTGYFLELLAFYTYFPVNKAVVEGNDEWANNADTHVSNGPFSLTEWVHDGSIKIRKNDNYYDAASINLDGVDFTIIEEASTTWQGYEGGEYDFLVDIPQAVTAKMVAEDNDELKLGAMVGTYYYNLNPDVKPFNNVKVRKALAYTLDRETITSKITQGGQIPAEGVVPFGIMDEDGTEYRDKLGKMVEFNLEEGKKLLAEGLEEEGMTVDDMKGLVLLYNTDEGHKKIAQAAQEMWRQNLGIEIQLENVDFNVKLDREKSGDYDISRAGWVGDYVDPMTFIDLWWSQSSFNDVKYNNPDYDAMVAEAKGTADQAIRFEAMRAAEKMIMEDMAVIPVYFYTQPYAQKPYVTGVYKPLVNYPKLTYADIER
ncbi:MAG TPA: peptide ABC transporter substrate-binding protein [Tissierellaceae bacterium]|nr:peptide ABC transporter substrate-binding protein [Tissierellaceae bacterium]